MSELIATIHFIGLCLFTTAASSDGKQLHVVLPRIQSTGTNLQMARTSVTAAQPRSTPGLAGVENHTAFLVYRDDDFLNAVGWIPQPLPGQPPPVAGQPSYKYIVLTGEAISFHTNAQNAATTGTPAGLPATKCCEAQKLRAAFKVADRSGAAAVFRIPEGKLQTCTSQPAGGNDGGPRIDTKLALTNSGVLVVWGDTKQTSRALILKGNATLYVANLPSQWVANSTYQHAHGSPSHYRVYPAMFEHGTATSCPIKDPVDPPVLPSRCGTIDKAFRFGDSPEQLALKKAHGSSGSSDSPTAVNSDCSNSSWP